MKKYKLIKTLTVATPVLLTPLVAASCGSNGNNKTKESNLNPSTPVSNEAKFYVTIFADQVQKEFATQAVQDVVYKAMAYGSTHELDFTSYVNTAINNAIAAGETAKNKPKDFNKEIFKSVIINTAIAQTLKLVVNGDSYKMYVYPTFNQNLSDITQTLAITYQLSLKNGSYQTKLNSVFKTQNNAVAITDDIQTNSQSLSANGDKVFYENTVNSSTNEINLAQKDANGSYNLSTLVSKSNELSFVKTDSAGNQVIYVEKINDTYQINNLAYNSTTKKWVNTIITTVANSISALKITPDGTQVFYVADNNVYKTYLNSGTWVKPVTIEAGVLSTIDTLNVTTNGNNVFVTGIGSDNKRKIIQSVKGDADKYLAKNITPQAKGQDIDFTKAINLQVTADGSKIFFVGTTGTEATVRWYAGLLQADKSYKWSNFSLIGFDPDAKITINSDGTEVAESLNDVRFPEIDFYKINANGSVASSEGSNIFDLANVSGFNNLSFTADGNTFMFVAVNFDNKFNKIGLSRINWFN